MYQSTPGLPVHHQLLEFTQTHIHRVSDAIQPSHPLWSPSPPAPIPPSIRVFSNESALRMRWPKSWSFSFSIIPSKEIPFQETQPRRGKNKSELQGLTLSSLVRACGMRRGVWGRASILSVMPNVAPDTYVSGIIQYLFFCI